MTEMPEESGAVAGDASPSQPRVVVVVSQGRLFSADTESLAGKKVIHVPIMMTNQPMTAIATTIATGVDPIFHGVATRVQIEPSDLSRRPTRSADCLYPRFWKDASNAGLRTRLLDWPITSGEAELHDSLSPEEVTSGVSTHPGTDHESVLLHLRGDATEDRINALSSLLTRLDMVLSEAEETLVSSNQPDLFGVVLRSVPQLSTSTTMLDTIGGRLSRLVGNLPASTCVLVVHNQEPLSEEGASENQWTLTIVGGEIIPQQRLQPINLRAIGGAIRLLAGVPCPIGVSQPKWPFLSFPETMKDVLPIPQGVNEDPTDWDDLVVRVLAMPDDDETAFDRSQNIDVLVNRQKVFAINSIQGKNWLGLERYSAHLVQLRGLPVHHWWHIYALDRLEKKVELQAAVANLASSYPDLPITMIAVSLLQAESDSEEAIERLKAIDPRQLKIKTALGTLGRLCLGLGLTRQGLEAIRLALQNRFAIPDDRTALAQYFLQEQQPEEAIRAMGSLGNDPNILPLCILRLKILLATGDKEMAEQHAAMILGHYPGEKTVLQMMGS